MWHLTRSSGARAIFLIMTALRETIKQMIPHTLNPQPNPITARFQYTHKITFPLKAGVLDYLHLMTPRKGLPMRRPLKIPEPRSRWGMDVLLGA